MSKPIPVQNLYYLLSYAWNDKLRTGDLDKITDEQCPDLANFFAQVLGQAVHQLIRRGLDRNYVTHHELTPQLKGRIDFAASAKRQTWIQGRMHCSYDDLSHDVLHNQIIHSTLRLLIVSKTLKKENRTLLHDQLDWFKHVTLIRVTPRTFRRVQLHRNNRSYQFILHLCELVYASLLPEHQNNGDRQFKRIEENEQVMPYIFEQFILAFAKRHYPEASIGRPYIQWLADYHTEGTSSLLPRMETDVIIDWPERKLIIDCKYYKQAFTKRQYGGQDSPEVEKFKTNNLYQIFAYLVNKREEAGWEHVEGMLLYPTTTDDFRHDFSLAGNRVQAASIDLNQNWKTIETNLKTLLTIELQVS